MSKSEKQTSKVFAVPLAPALAGKDTAGKNIAKKMSDLVSIHISTLLQVRIEQNKDYQRIVQEGGLLPPDEAIKAFRTGFTQSIAKLYGEQLPHIYANGACREESETRAILLMVKRARPLVYRLCALRFMLDKEHIMDRAQQRIDDDRAAGREPRPDDLGQTPLIRYELFQKGIAPVLKEFEHQKGFVVEIDANQSKQGVMDQIYRVYKESVCA